ncbi:MAG TPA: hypothetical protein VE987_22785 [Polyangiaceae bacterium]|nr:hypothetical protein [Polyangiaceae bacterium]
MLSQLRSCSLGAAIAVGAFSLLCGGCSTPTKSTEVWKNPTYTGGPVKSVVVFGGRMSDANRRVVEDGLAGAVAEHGVRATPSYAMFPGALPSEDVARRAVLDGGYDGVLVSTMRGVTERTTLDGDMQYSRLWGGYYGPYWGSTWEPGYADTDTYVKFETTLWDPRTGGMIWSDLTQTENPISTPDFVKSLIKNVVPAMEKAGLLPPVSAGAPVSYNAPAASPR